MTFRIRLRDRRSGKEQDIDEINFRDTVLYSWTEGNFSCDCNRSIRMYNLPVDKAWACNRGPNTIEVLSITALRVTDDSIVREVIYDRQSGKLEEYPPDGTQLCPKITTQ